MRQTHKKKDELNTLIEFLSSYKGKNEEVARQILRFVVKPGRQQKEVNIGKISKKAAEGDNVVIPGKVLGKGAIDKKITLAASSFARSARQKLEGAGCTIMDIKDMLQKDNLKIVF
ncbi:MAG: 50S ribosomal protein L18e [Candidatus Micrarchaeia archaeon]